VLIVEPWEAVLKYPYFAKIRMSALPKPRHRGEEIYLDGARSRSYEFFFSVRVMLQFIKGFRTLHFAGPCITVFGSARYKEDHAYYRMARTVGQYVAEKGFTTMTGGGPGIMEAANRGAIEHKGRSVGVNIQLPMEQAPNPYLDTHVNIRYFFIRKVLLLKYSYGFIVLPGGFGTMDEFFETLTLVQTRSIRDFPIVLLGTDYYRELMEAIDDMVKEGTISADDLKLVKLTDDPAEAVEFVSTYVKKNYKIKRRRRAFWWLFEGMRFKGRTYFPKSEPKG